MPVKKGIVSTGSRLKVRITRSRPVIAIEKTPLF